MEHLYEKALQSAEYIRSHITRRPKIAVVLGSGRLSVPASGPPTDPADHQQRGSHVFLSDDPAVQ